MLLHSVSFFAFSTAFRTVEATAVSGKGNAVSLRKSSDVVSEAAV